MGSYWENKGKYDTAQLDALVPVMGPAHTLKGEIWRAATRIYYDLFNNGWGNNWSRSAAFLMDHVNVEPELGNVLLEHGNGNVAWSPSEYYEQMDQMLNLVIETLNNMEDKVNEVDCLKYSTARYEFAEEEFWD